MKNTLGSFLLTLSLFGCTHDAEYTSQETRVVVASEPCPNIGGDSELTASVETDRTPICWYRIGECDDPGDYSYETLHESQTSRLGDPDMDWHSFTTCTNDGLILQIAAGGAECPETNGGPLLAADARPALRQCSYDVQQATVVSSCGGSGAGGLQ